MVINDWSSRQEAFSRRDARHRGLFTFYSCVSGVIKTNFMCSTCIVSRRTQVVCAVLLNITVLEVSHKSAAI